MQQERSESKVSRAESLKEAARSLGQELNP